MVNKYLKAGNFGLFCSTMVIHKMVRGSKAKADLFLACRVCRLQVCRPVQPISECHIRWSHRVKLPQNLTFTSGLILFTTLTKHKLIKQKCTLKPNVCGHFTSSPICAFWTIHMLHCCYNNLFWEGISVDFGAWLWAFAHSVKKH